MCSGYASIPKKLWYLFNVLDTHRGEYDLEVVISLGNQKIASSGPSTEQRHNVRSMASALGSVAVWSDEREYGSKVVIGGGQQRA